MIHNESIVKERSRCEYCHHPLKWYELIPILSYIIQGGECHYCHKKIRPMHIICEIIGGIICLLSYYHYPILEMMIMDIICFILLMIAVIDYYTYDIYIPILIILLFFVIIYAYIISRPIQSIIISLSYCIPLYIIYMVYRDSLGLGDIQLLSIIGLIHSFYEYYLILTIACIIASLHIFIYRKKGIKKIPFVPYIVIATYLIMLF